MGRSTVLNTDFDVSRIAVTNPAVADAVVVAPREILIDGKGPGTVSLIVWGPTQRSQYDVVVEPGISVLQQQLQQLFPGENIQVGFSDQATILSGSVSSNAVMLRAGEIAQATSPKLKVINMLQLPGGVREPAGHAAGAVRRGESPRAHGSRRERCSHQDASFDARARRRSSSPAPDFEDESRTSSSSAIS